MNRDRLYIALSAAIWLAALWTVAGCNDVNTALNISARPEIHGTPTVYDPMPGYAFYCASELGKPVGVMPEPAQDFAAFKAWKANDDPSLPWAGVRRWLREQDQR